MRIVRYVFVCVKCPGMAGVPRTVPGTNPIKLVISDKPLPSALWLMLLWKAGLHWNKFFGSRQQLLTNGFFGQMFTYVLFWTFLYGMVHVY
jgi:hypothetical protein